MRKVTMRKSRILEKLRSGQKAISYKTNLKDAWVAEIAGLAGFDGFWTCMEHVPSSYETIVSQVQAGKIYDMDTIVRVQKGCYSDYILPLEADAAVLMIPHLMSAAEAREIVNTVRFYPLGRRPVDGGNADGKFCLVPFTDYIKFVNENRMVIVQIEDPEPLAELDEICQVPGIDMIFFGPGDFSHAIGTPGDMSNPEIARVRKLIVDTAHKYGKFAGTVSGPDTLKEYYDMGYDYLNCGADVIAIGNQCKSIIESFDQATKK